MEEYWDVYHRVPLENERRHWYLAKRDSTGADAGYYEWTIVCLRDGFYLSSMMYPPIRINKAFRESLAAGPLPTLDAAKVAYMLRVANGQIDRY